MCAMLNQRGGHVLFGVTPTGDVSGQQVSERTIELNLFVDYMIPNVDIFSSMMSTFVF